MRNLKIMLMAGVLFFCASCSKLQHIGPALTLKGYADEQEAQRVDVKRRDALFEQLLLAVKTGEFQKTVKTAAELEHRFGEPVLKMPQKGISGVERWLYRRQVDYFHSPKVYVSVDVKGALTGVTQE